jgi:exopolyphosphatase/guanosine-5'-triphosphate,3'-diphosphate pyrophosphatase
MSREFFGDGVIRRKRMRDAQLYARQELESIEEPYRSVGWSAAVGASGTIITVANLIAARGWGDGISLGALRKLCDVLIEAGRVDKLSLPGRQAERAPVFPGGIAILMATFEALGIDRMNCAHGALREGILYDMLRRFTHTDVRESTINDLCRRYHVELEQAERVERTALELHEKVAKAWRLRKERYANMLGWAARLHEIGLSIAHNQYHKHGAYLLENSDLPGFSRQEQNLLAALVRSHRRKFTVQVFEPLSSKLRDRVERMAILLRLSVALHRSRVGSQGLEFVVEADDRRSLRFIFPPGWLDEHPLTAVDLHQEAAYLEAAGYTLSVAQAEASAET